jgi:hypothetical protein
MNVVTAILWQRRLYEKRFQQIHGLSRRPMLETNMEFGKACDEEAEMMASGEKEMA